MVRLTPFCCMLALALGTGGRAAETKPGADGEVYELPPFVTTGIVMGAAWRHGSIPGYEVLSQCSDSETREIVAALWRGRQLVLPPAMRPHFSLPMTVVLFNQPGSAGGNLSTFGTVRASHEIQPHWTNLIKRTLEDRESFALNLWPNSFEYSAAFRFDLFTLFRRRSPAAPVWLNEGLFGSYGVYREGVYWYASMETKAVHVAVWCSQKEAEMITRFYLEEKEMFDKKKWPRKGPSPLQEYLVELQALFEQPPPRADDPGADRWASTVALFVRWGTYDCPPEQVDQFWRFAERASHERVNEAIFKECFGGRSYADVRNELSWYLPRAFTNKGEASASDLASMPKLVLKDATNAQIARVRGEWERMEAAALAPGFPDLAKSYREQAARTLALGLKKDVPVDPRLQASLGLLALENGDLKQAQKHLETAVAGKVPGPRPYLELARLRWAAARLDDTGALPPEALAGVMDLLLDAERQEPPLLSVYLLLAEAVKRRGIPTAEQAAALERGRGFFPRQAERLGGPPASP